MRKLVPKDPRKYVRAIEKGLPEKNIPPRPLVGNTFDEFRKTFLKRVRTARSAISAAWK